MATADRGSTAQDRSPDPGTARVDALLAQANQLANVSLAKMDRRPYVRARWLAVGATAVALLIVALVLTLAGGDPAESATSTDLPTGTPVSSSAATPSAAPVTSTLAAAPAGTSPSVESSPPMSSSPASTTTAALVPEAAAAGPVPVVEEVRVLDSTLLFTVDSHTLLATALPALDELVVLLAERPDVTLEIVGHTDSVGSEVYNLALSERRARAVAAYLEQRGADPARLSAVGRGESEPVAGNDTREGRAANRRIDVHVREQDTP